MRTGSPRCRRAGRVWRASEMPRWGTRAVQIARSFEDEKGLSVPRCSAAQAHLTSGVSGERSGATRVHCTPGLGAEDECLRLGNGPEARARWAGGIGKPRALVGDQGRRRVARRRRRRGTRTDEDRRPWGMPEGVKWPGRRAAEYCERAAVDASTGLVRHPLDESRCGATTAAVPANRGQG